MKLDNRNSNNMKIDNRKSNNMKLEQEVKQHEVR